MSKKCVLIFSCPFKHLVTLQIEPIAPLEDPNPEVENYQTTSAVLANYKHCTITIQRLKYSQIHQASKLTLDI